jgi:hypothetical protein
LGPSHFFARNISVLGSKYLSFGGKEPKFGMKFGKKDLPRAPAKLSAALPSCQQVWNKLLTTCNKLDGIIRLVARLF